MKIRSRLRTAAFCLALAAVPGAAFAGEADVVPLNPSSQPLVVAHSGTASIFDSLLATRQLRAAGLADRDYSGRLPGVEARVSSLRDFLTALVRDNAEDIWFCLAQDGGFIAKQTGALGWKTGSPPADASEKALQEWLARLGLRTDKLLVRLTPEGASPAHIVVSRDEAAEMELFGGGRRDNKPWRSTLKTFLSERNDELGLLINGRPLLGLAGMAFGVDLRGELSRARLSFPESIQLGFFNNEGDLGFSLRCHGLVPPEQAAVTGKKRTLLESGRNAILEIHLTDPGRICSLFGVDTLPFFLANLNIRPLIPATATLSVWRTGDGALAWSLIGLMPDRERFSQQERRVRAWLEVLHDSPSSPVTLASGVSPTGDELLSVKIGRQAFVMGSAEAPGRAAYWIFAGRADDWPDATSLRSRNEAQEGLAHFVAAPNDEDRAFLVSTLAMMARRGNLGGDTEAMLENMLPEKDNGYLRLDGGALEFRSRHGLLPFLLAALLEHSSF